MVLHVSSTVSEVTLSHEHVGPFPETQRTLNLNNVIILGVNGLKLCKYVVTEEDAGIIREDLRRMYKWVKDWQMLFDVNKCSVMHIGKGNKKFKYDIGGSNFKSLRGRPVS